MSPSTSISVRDHECWNKPERGAVRSKSKRKVSSDWSVRFDLRIGGPRQILVEGPMSRQTSSGEYVSGVDGKASGSSLECANGVCEYTFLNHPRPKELTSEYSEPRPSTPPHSKVPSPKNLPTFAWPSFCTGRASAKSLGQGRPICGGRKSLNLENARRRGREWPEGRR